MTVLTNVLQSFATVGDKVSLAHVFTGVGSDLVKLKEVIRSNQSKEAFTKPRHIDVSPSILGNSTEIVIQKAHLRKAEDDRWEQVEGGSPLRWRSCRACAFLCAADELTCEACGAKALLLDVPSSEVGSGKTRQASAEHEEKPSRAAASSRTLSLKEVVVADAVPPLQEHVDSQKPTMPSSVLEQVQTDGTCDSGSESGDDSSDEDSDCEYEKIEGTLDTPPPAGTEVKVLYSDDIWYLARVLTVRGNIARVIYRNGRQTTLNFDDHAVRLAAYCEKEEGPSDSEEDEEDKVREQEEKGELLPVAALGEEKLQ